VGVLTAISLRVRLPVLSVTTMMSTLKKALSVRAEASAPTFTRTKNETAEACAPLDSELVLVDTKVSTDTKEEKKDVIPSARLSRGMRSLKGDGMLKNVYFALFFNQAASSSSYLSAILAVNPGSTSDWGYITSLYDDFRVTKVQFELYMTPNVAVNLGTSNILGMAYDRDAVPGTAGITMTSLVQFQNHKIYAPGYDGHKFVYTHRITTPVTAAPSLTALPITIERWQPVNSASAFYYGGVYLSSTTAFAANFNIPMVIKYWVDLRVRH